MGEAGDGRAALQNSFALWKDADPDLPILKEAEYEQRSGRICEETVTTASRRRTRLRHLFAKVLVNE